MARRSFPIPHLDIPRRRSQPKRRRRGSTWAMSYTTVDGQRVTISAHSKGRSKVGIA
jgi:hypothetical protein